MKIFDFENAATPLWKKNEWKRGFVRFKPKEIEIKIEFIIIHAIVIIVPIISLTLSANKYVKVINNLLLYVPMNPHGGL